MVLLEVQDLQALMVQLDYQVALDPMDSLVRQELVPLVLQVLLGRMERREPLDQLVSGVLRELWEQPVSLDLWVTQVNRVHKELRDQQDN